MGVTQDNAWQEPPIGGSCLCNSHPRHLSQNINAANDRLYLQHGGQADVGDVHERALKDGAQMLVLDGRLSTLHAGRVQLIKVRLQ
eukprot:12783445-Prorocentrum_lima.AAC.1